MATLQMNFPNYNKGLRWGLGCGFVCAALWFANCYFISTLPAISEVSLSLAFQPWWRHWLAGVIIFVIVSIIVGLFAALRPNFPKK
jgi:hypothetical protein